MLQRLVFSIKYFLFWLVFFIAMKFVFLIFFIKDAGQHLKYWDDIIFHGMRLDISATGYIMLLPLLLLVISLIFPGKWSGKVIRIYTISLVAAVALLSATDLGIYRDWGFRMDATPLYYMTKPGEALTSVSTLLILGLIGIASAIAVIFSFLYSRIFKRVIFQKREPLWSPVAGIVVIGCMILPIRGGLGTSPINIGSAYFSNENFINHAAINLPWNILYSLTNFEASSNPYSLMPVDRAQSLIQSAKPTGDPDRQVITSAKPNIILVILESFSASATSCINPKEISTPNLDKLAKSGILFSNCYSSGDRTDKGLVSIFGGYPAQPTTSIIKFPNKTQSLPSLTKELRNAGYHTAYYYGGDIEFANYQSYLLNAKFGELISMKDFETSKRICNWGVPDEYLFARMTEDILKMPKPYFVSCITLNSHPPYDIPAKPAFPGDDEKSKYLSSVYYTDSCIGSFIVSLHDKDLLENTLVIFISDHGSRWPYRETNSSPASFHIPMIWYGDVLAIKDTVFSGIVSQTDLASTLLSQLSISTTEFEYSHDIFGLPPPGRAVYAFNNGFGYISPSSVFIYNRAPDNARFLSGEINDQDLEWGKAFYQLLYEDIIHR
jgi:phosphoglycerol transferase MdoB-like AlkP superfamily enzyme